MHWLSAGVKLLGSLKNPPKSKVQLWIDFVASSISTCIGGECEDIERLLSSFPPRFPNLFQSKIYLQTQHRQFKLDSCLGNNGSIRPISPSSPTNVGTPDRLVRPSAPLLARNPVISTCCYSTVNSSPIRVWAIVGRFAPSHLRHPPMWERRIDWSGPPHCCSHESLPSRLAAAALSIQAQFAFGQ